MVEFGLNSWKSKHWCLFKVFWRNLGNYKTFPHTRRFHWISKPAATNAELTSKGWNISTDWIGARLPKSCSCRTDNNPCWCCQGDDTKYQGYASHNSNNQPWQLHFFKQETYNKSNSFARLYLSAISSIHFWPQFFVSGFRKRKTYFSYVKSLIFKDNSQNNFIKLTDVFT